MFFQLGLKGVFLTHRVRFPFRTYVVVQLLAAAIGAILAVSIAAFVATDFVVTVAIVCLIKIGDSISDVFAGPLQKYSATRTVFWGTTISSVSSAVAAIVVLAVTRDLNLTLAALAVVSTAAVAGFMWIPGARIVSHAERSNAAPVASAASPAWTIVRAGLPIGAGAALIALVASLPQYFLSASKGADAVAHFAVLFYTVALADIFMSTLVQGWIPRAREATVHPELAPHGFYRFLLQTSLLWTLLLIPISILGIAAAWFIIPAVFGHSYILTFVVSIGIACAIATLPIASFSNVGIIVQNLYLHSVTLAVVSALASLLFCALLIPSFGIAGAFGALAAASLTRSIPSMALLRRHERNYTEAL